MSKAVRRENCLIISTEGQGVMAIPRAVVEAGRITGAALDELYRLVEAGNVSGFSGGVVLPYAGDGRAYALPSEMIARYQLSARDAEALAAERDDVSGLSLFPGPPSPCQAGTTPVYFGSFVRCVGTPVVMVQPYPGKSPTSAFLSTAYWH